jgi:hypothetical protein
MSLLAVQGGATGTGSVTLLAPSTNATQTLTLPDATGTVVSTGSVVTPAMLTQPLTSGTAQASTSGTSIDFTGIPSWVKRITVMFNGVSTSGTSIPIVQLGYSSGITIAGYNGTTAYIAGTPGISSVTTGIGLGANASANYSRYGSMSLVNVSGATWIGSYLGGITEMGIGGGGITLAGTLDRIRITTVNGTDTFDAGSINILWE